MCVCLCVYCSEIEMYSHSTILGGVAEKARLKVGDTVLEVNGHDCRKNTDILRITELKMLIQQASLDSEDEDLDVGYFFC